MHYHLVQVIGQEVQAKRRDQSNLAKALRKKEQSVAAEVSFLQDVCKAKQGVMFTEFATRSDPAYRRQESRKLAEAKRKVRK